MRRENVTKSEQIYKAKMERLAEIVKDLEKENACHCNLDHWEPEHNTGHTLVCPIHKMAWRQFQKEYNL
jgi:hypothetical protein